MERDINIQLKDIRKVIQSDSLNQVNLLLDNGWTILEIQKTNDGYPHPSDSVIYHLGHTDPNADECEEHRAFEGL